MNEKRRAVIDLGTVTARLLVADVHANSIEEIERQVEFTQLGLGLVETGTICEESLQRAANVADSYVECMQRLGMDIANNDLNNSSVVAIATSAARDATNSHKLVEIFEQRNIPIAVISGDEEASLSFAGATYDFKGSNILVNDIGGGSTELILGDALPGKPAVIHKEHSFNVGCRRVTEMFLHSDPPTLAELNQAREWIRQQIGVFFSDVRHIDKLVGVAGTVTSIISIREKMQQYDSKRVHGAIATAGEVDAILQRLANMALSQRCSVVGLQPQRASVFVAGLLILQQLMQLCGTSELTVSEHDNMLGMMMRFQQRI